MLLLFILKHKIIYLFTLYILIIFLLNKNLIYYFKNSMLKIIINNI